MYILVIFVPNVTSYEINHEVFVQLLLTKPTRQSITD